MPARAISLIADRFMYVGGQWFDLATCRPVVLHVGPAGSVEDQLAWADRSSILARLRHPLLQPLVDFGASDAASLFEAYAACPPIETSGAAAHRLMTHGVRFLEAHGVALTRGLAERALRRLVFGPAARGRPIGVVLQHRRALDLVTEIVEAGAIRGVVSVRVAGAPGSGLRTFQDDVARVARTAGYAPVAVEAILRWPAVTSALSGRHLCLLGTAHAPPDAHAARASLLSRLGVESARGHVSVTFDASADPPPGSVRLDALGVTAMTGMVYIDRDLGPDPDELFDAARSAAGLPGRFLTALRATTPAGGFTVHETPIPYVLSRELDPPRASVERRRIGRALVQAEARAARLAARGRHTAAVRLLERAATVLAGREHRSEAAARLLTAAWIMRNRGNVTGAAAAAERSRTLTSEARVQVHASLALGVCWTDERRFAEAEAALRTALAAAADLQSPALGARCTLALARTLYWAERMDEAIALVQPLASSDDPAIRCGAAALAARGLAASRRSPEAIRTARNAIDASLAAREPVWTIAAHRAMAEAMNAAGDLAGVREHVRHGLAASRHAHLPLAAFRLRIVFLRALAASGQQSEHHALRVRLERAARSVPALLRKWLRDSIAAARSGPSGLLSAVDVRPPIEDLLVVAHRAADDRGALQDVANAVLERLRAASVIVATTDPRKAPVLPAAGRPWRERCGAAVRAVSGGVHVAVDPFRQPAEAAEPVRYGDQVVGALACRWPIGATIEPGSVTTVLRAAALAIAPHLRALLDAAVPEPPPAVWGDMLGDSAPAAALRDAVVRAARAPFPVLVEGESGSGKELVARAIHRLGARRDRRLCAINCAAISDELVEAELFGHARGAFTGAAAERAGLFEEADGGTLFLDEVGELAPRAQAKLLRVLQDGEVRRVGENFPRKVDVRIVAATNRRLEEEAAAGRFRSDLRFRLDVIRITVPPLRDRIPDIAILASHFWQQASARVGSRATLGPDVLAALSRYDWPGNVRELQNAVAWMAVQAPHRGRVGAAMLPAHVAGAGPLATGSFEAAREDFERRFVRAALARAGGRRSRAAQVLGVSRQGLAKMLRRLRIDAP